MRRRKPAEPAEPAEIQHLVPGSYAFIVGHLVGRLPAIVIPELYDLAANREAPRSARVLAGRIAHDFKALQETGP